jgi:hypothetical protein
MKILVAGGNRFGDSYTESGSNSCQIRPFT